MKIVITDKIDIPSSLREKLRELGVTVYDDVPKSDQELLARVKEAQIITANYVDVTAGIIDQLPELQYIIVPSVGYEWVDVTYAKSKGVTVLNCPTHNSQAVAEHAFALLFALNRKLLQASNSLRQGAWNPTGFLGTEVQGKQLGLIGYGNVGRRIEKIGAALEMNVAHINSKSSEAEIDKLVASSDVLGICAPLNDFTKGMIDSKRLDSMKPAAVIINVGRGAILDQDHLFENLTSGKLRGAGLDVFIDETFSGKANTKISKLAQLSNVVATPHLAYNTLETRERLGEELLADIKSCMDGSPINVVTP